MLHWGALFLVGTLGLLLPGGSVMAVSLKDSDLFKESMDYDDWDIYQNVMMSLNDTEIEDEEEFEEKRRSLTVKQPDTCRYQRPLSSRIRGDNGKFIWRKGRYVTALAFYGVLKDGKDEHDYDNRYKDRPWELAEWGFTMLPHYKSYDDGGTKTYSDCNINAGDSGHPIFAFQSRKSIFGPPLTAIIGHHDPHCPEGFRLVGISGTEVGQANGNINQGVHGKNVWICTSSEEKHGKPIKEIHMVHHNPGGNYNVGLCCGWDGNLNYGNRHGGWNIWFKIIR